MLAVASAGPMSHAWSAAMRVVRGVLLPTLAHDFKIVVNFVKYQ